VPDKLQTQIEISINLYYLKRDEFDKLSELSREIERMLSSLETFEKCSILLKFKEGDQILNQV